MTRSEPSDVKRICARPHPSAGSEPALERSEATGSEDASSSVEMY